MKTITVYKRDGSEAGTIELPDDIFGIEPSHVAIHQVIKAHLANKRQGNASAKTRSEVNLTGSKLFRQKGTGRARSGSMKSPLKVGGGVAFGPKPRSFRQKINQKVRSLALKSAYSIKAAENSIKVVEDFTLAEPKTGELANLLRSLGINKGKNVKDSLRAKTIFLLGDSDEMIYKSSRNIPKLSVKVTGNAHTYEVMNSDVLIFMKSALEKMKVS